MRNLKPGRWYKFLFLQQGGNYHWYLTEMTAQLVEDKGSELVVSLRPLAGTSVITDLQEAVPAKQRTPSLPQRIRKVEAPSPAAKKETREKI